MPLGVLGHCDGVKGLCTQAALSPKAAEGWGGLGLHRSLLSPSTLSPGHPQVHPLPVWLQPSQRDHSSPAWLWAVTAGVHLLRRKGPSLGCRVGGLGWVGSVGPSLCPSLHPHAVGSLGMCICKAGSLLSPSLLQQVLCVFRSTGRPSLGRRRSVFGRGRTQG